MMVLITENLPFFLVIAENWKIDRAKFQHGAELENVCQLQIEMDRTKLL